MMSVGIGATLLAALASFTVALAIHESPGRLVTFATGGAAVAVNPATNRIYYPDSVVDGATNRVIARYPHQNSNAMAANPVTNRVYRADFDTASVSVIDGATSKIVATVPVGPHPGGIAVNPDTNRIYVGDDTGVSVVDGATNTTIATIPAGGGVVGVDVDPVTNRVYAASGFFFQGVIVADGATNTVLTLIPLPGSRPWDVAVDPMRNRLYVVRAGASQDLLAIDAATSSVLGVVLLGGSPTGVAVNSTTDRVYVTSSFDNRAFVFDGTTLAIVQTFVGCDGAPHQVDIDPLRDRAYVGARFGPAWAIDDAPPDTDPPVVRELSFSANPKRPHEASVLTATATDDAWGLLRGELRFGPSGPWQPMTLSGSTLSRTVFLPSPDVYHVDVRTIDNACRTSAISSGELVVYDPEAGFATGAGGVVSGDGYSQFSFTVRYATATTPTGTFDFREPDNGFRMSSMAIAWMAVTRASWAKIGGTAAIAGSPGEHPFRLSVRDGDRTGDPDEFVLRVFAPGANPLTAMPLYEASGEPYGEISIQRDESNAAHAAAESKRP